MELLATFYKEDVIDCYTFVFNERSPQTGYYAMLATDKDGLKFSQWTDGFYDPSGTNEHLGKRELFQSLGKVLVAHVLGRMSE